MMKTIKPGVNMGRSIKLFCILFILFLVLPVFVYAAGVEVSVVCKKIVSGSPTIVSFWDLGTTPIKGAEVRNSCVGTACDQEGDVYWDVTGSSNGQENILAMVESSGLWQAAAASAQDRFVLKVGVNGGALSNALPAGDSGTITIGTAWPKATTYRLRLSLTTPSTVNSEQGQHYLTITLTATNWVAT